MTPALKNLWRRFAGDAAWVLALRLVRQVLAIVVVAVLVRLVSQETFGRYQLAVTLIGVLAFCALPGMQRAVIQATARGAEGTFRPATRLVFRFSLAGSLMLLAAAAWFWRGDNGDQALALMVAAVLFPASQGMNQWQHLQIGRREYRSNTVRVSIGAIASSAAVILVAFAGFTSPAALVAAFFGVLALQNLYQQYSAFRSIPAEAAVERDSLAYGLNTSKWDVLNTVANYVDRLFVFTAGSAEALAIYAVADRIPEVLKANLQQLMQVLIPGFAKRQVYTRDLDRKLSLVAAAMAAALLVFAFAVIPFLLPFLYTDAYREAVLYCQLILVSIAIGSFAVVKNAYIHSKPDARSARNITVWMSVVRIVSSAVLVWRFGILGAALSTIVYRITSVVVVEYHIRRHYLERVRD